MELVPDPNAVYLVPWTEDATARSSMIAII